MTARPPDKHDYLDHLKDIGHSIGVEVRIGEPWDESNGLDIVGNPPAGAALCTDAQGRPVVLTPTSDSPRAAEEVLHELAHHVMGLEREGPCYERQAVWALRLGPEVAAAVAEMARHVAPWW